MSRFNSLKFNRRDRNKYVGTVFKSTSKVIADLNNVSAFLICKLSLYLKADKQNGTNAEIAQSIFGGGFNRLRFNRRSRIKYAGISLTGTAHVQILQDNISAFLSSQSTLTASSDRVRYIKRKFKPRSKILLNPHAEFSANLIFKSSSSYKPNIYKYMVSSISLTGTCEIMLINYMARFTGLNLESNTLFNLQTFTLSMENLILTSLNFKPNDIIVIDLDNYCVSHNGTDITYKVSGNFFRLYPNENVLYYKDDVIQRMVRKDIVYQNKYLN